MSQGRLQQRHVLQVASEVRRHGGERREAAARAGSREHEAEEVAGRSGAGQRSTEGGLRGKALSPPAKRRAVGKMLEATKISERRACALVELARDSWRHPPRRAQLDQDMSERIVGLAHERRRFGYRRIADLIRAEGTAINDKRVYRLYRLADLAVRKRRGKGKLKLDRVPLHECTTINEVWSLDF